MNKKRISLLLIFGIIALFTNGFVMTNLWRWLVVPITHFQEISLTQALGIGIFASWMVLGIGYLISLFV